MKKALCMIALAAISFGIASAATPVKLQSDTTKIKTKMAHHTYKRKTKGPNKKVKTKMKDTTKTT
jgi:hypothetical protein